MELAALLREYIRDAEELLKTQGNPTPGNQLLEKYLELVLLEKRFPAELFSCSECSCITEDRREIYRHVIERHGRGESLYKHTDFSGEPPTLDINEETGDYICSLCGEQTTERVIKRNWASRHGVPCRNRFKLELTYQCILQDEDGQPCSGEAATLKVFLDHLVSHHEQSPLFSRISDRDEILVKLGEDDTKADAREFILRIKKEAEKIVEEYLPYFEGLLVSNTSCVKTPEGWTLASLEPEEIIEVEPVVSPEETAARRIIEKEQDDARKAKDAKKVKKPRARKPAEPKTAPEPTADEPIDADVKEEILEIDADEEEPDEKAGLPEMRTPDRPFVARPGRKTPPMPPKESQPANFGNYESSLLCLLAEHGTLSADEAKEKLSKYYTVPTEHQRVIGSGEIFWEESVIDSLQNLVDLTLAEPLADRWTITEEGRQFCEMYAGKLAVESDEEIDSMEQTGEYSAEDLTFAEEGPNLSYDSKEDAEPKPQEKAPEKPEEQSPKEPDSTDDAPEEKEETPESPAPE
ncbi:MAG: hypothetical protein E3J72_06105 [Planctomycetota bacterium]|nr:MAG: hypothetical protein E3J72_06105 [Planctomycetota bacterium]